MPKKQDNPEAAKPNQEITQLNAKLDVVLALLLRQLNDEALAKWDKQDKPNMVRMLIDLDFDNPTISRIVGLTYNSVANIRSAYKKEKSK